MWVKNVARIGAVALFAFTLSACAGGNSTPPASMNSSSDASSTLHPMSAAGFTIHRPISDFVNAQNGFFYWVTARSSLPTGTGCDVTAAGPYVFGIVDYLGTFNTTNGMGLPTTVSGSVSQSPNKDGTTSTVSVQLDTTNAYALGGCETPDFNTGTRYFGYDVLDVLAGKPAALATSHFSAVFTIVGTGAGAPLPNLTGNGISFAPPACTTASAPCVETTKLQATASGALRSAYGVADGTPGTMTIEQTGTGHSTGRAGVSNTGLLGFTADFVQIQPAK